MTVLACMSLQIICLLPVISCDASQVALGWLITVYIICALMSQDHVLACWHAWLSKDCLRLTFVLGIAEAWYRYLCPNALAIPAGAAAYALCALLLDRCVLQCSHMGCT